MMAERETETDAREEAWVIATNPDFPIRARNVNWFLERGGSIKEVRLTESETGEWSVWLRLAGRSGEHRLAMFKSDEPRLYRDGDAERARAKQVIEHLHLRLRGSHKDAGILG